MFLLMASLFSQTSLADTPCLDATHQVDLARRAMLETRTEDAEILLERAVEALGCSAVPTPEALAGLWLTYGALSFLHEDGPGTQHAFAAAHRASPTTWYPELGYELRALYERAAETDLGTGTLRLQNLSAGLDPVLDGAPATFPQEVAAGPHLVQFVERSTPREARVVTVPAGETFLIDASLLQPTGDTGQAAATPGTSRRWGLLVVGGVSAAAAGGTFALARQQSTVMETAPSLTALDGALGKQKLYGGATYGLSALALSGVGLFIVL